MRRHPERELGDRLAGIFLDRTQQLARFLGRRDRGEVLGLGDDDRAAEIGSHVALATGRRDPVPEDAADDAAHAAGAFIAPRRL